MIEKENYGKVLSAFFEKLRKLLHLSQDMTRFDYSQEKTTLASHICET